MSTVRAERVSFPGYRGDPLAARLERSDKIPLGYALFARCFTCSKDFFAVTRISNTLAQRGIAVLRFDFTGLGNSGGDFSNTNFSSNIADLVQAVSFMRAQYQAPQLLIGRSLGGAAVLAAAEEIPETLAVATINAPSDPAHERVSLTSES
ncbi:alpha/beta fold hydrolase [Nitrosococcus watsonii]|uniref:alpha/beta fold hydrolase n=1 Tax=Nitrosococcus watsonii TaxID=473531 RepID=UPI0003072713|nr:alpha/beta fold hydrolase [Nitrosococcus watsonii]